MVIDLAAIRRAAGITQEQLAERLGVRQGQISRTERQADPLSTLVAYFRALGVAAELTVTVPGGETIHHGLTDPAGEDRNALTAAEWRPVTTVTPSDSSGAGSSGRPWSAGGQHHPRPGNRAQGSRWLAAAVAAVPPTVLLSVRRTRDRRIGQDERLRRHVSRVGHRDRRPRARRVPEELRRAAGPRGDGRDRARIAAVLPLIIDVAVAVATAALVAVGDKPARRARNATRCPDATPLEARLRARHHEKGARPHLRLRTRQRDFNRARRRAGATSQVAAELVAAKTDRQPVEIVAAILAAHQDGDPLNRIAAAIGVHHSAVKRVLDAADTHRERQSRTAA